MDLLSLERYGMIREIWFYLKMNDKINLLTTNKEFREMSLRINKEVSVEVTVPLWSKTGYKSKNLLLENIIKYFPNISNLLFKEFYGKPLSVIYDFDSICDSLEELKVQMNYDGLKGISKLRNLHTLNLMASSDEYFPIDGLYNISLLSNLQSLDLSLCGNLLNTKEAKKYLSCMTNLVHLNIGDSINKDEGLPFLQFLTNLEILDVKNCYFSTGEVASLSFLTNLDYLDISGHPENGRPYFNWEELIHLSSMTTITKLNLIEWQVPLEGYGFLQNLTDLIYLDMSHTMTEGVIDIGLSCLVNLTCLNLTECPNITKFGLSHISKLTNLNILILDNNEDLSDEEFYYLKELTELIYLTFDTSIISDIGMSYLSNLSNLQYLNIYLCVEITNIGLSHLSNMNNLTDLDISDLPLLTDYGLSFLSKLSNLIFLDLSNCPQISDFGLSHLSNLFKLKQLELSQCVKITNIGIIMYLSHLPVLNNLCIDDCPLITLNGLGCLPSSIKIGKYNRDIIDFSKFLKNDFLKIINNYFINYNL